MKASDIAYLTALVEKAPSNYPRRAELVEELQSIYRNAQGGKFGGRYRVPVIPSMSVMEVDRE